MIFRSVSNRASRAFAVIRSGLLILQKAGLRIFLQKLGHQLYSSTVFLFMEKEPDDNDAYPPSLHQCVVTPASPEDVEEFFQKMVYESEESRYQLLVRKWFYESGLHNCYIARTSDTNEMCHIRWMVTSRDMRETGYEIRLPTLKEDDVLAENAYTLERFRGRGINTAAARPIDEIYRKQGFRRIMSYIDENNIPSLKTSKKRGNKVFERVLERHILFRVTWKMIERFDPPVPIHIPGDKEASQS